MTPSTVDQFYPTGERRKTMVDIEMESNSILQGKKEDIGRKFTGEQLYILQRKTLVESTYTGEQFHPAEKKKDVS